LKTVSASVFRLRRCAISGAVPCERVVRVPALGEKDLELLEKPGKPFLERNVLAEEDEVNLVVASTVPGSVRPIKIGGIVLAEIVLAVDIGHDLAAVRADQDISVVFGMLT
jgi:hypothetical protein